MDQRLETLSQLSEQIENDPKSLDSFLNLAEQMSQQGGQENDCKTSTSEILIQKDDFWKDGSKSVFVPPSDHTEADIAQQLKLHELDPNFESYSYPTKENDADWTKEQREVLPERDFDHLVYPDHGISFASANWVNDYRVYQDLMLCAKTLNQDGIIHRNISPYSTLVNFESLSRVYSEKVRLGSFVYALKKGETDDKPLKQEPCFTYPLDLRWSHKSWSSLILPIYKTIKSFPFKEPILQAMFIDAIRYYKNNKANKKISTEAADIYSVGMTILYHMTQTKAIGQSKSENSEESEQEDSEETDETNRFLTEVVMPMISVNPAERPSFDTSLEKLDEFM